MRIAACLTCFILIQATAPASAQSYDDTWYKTDFWSGEYPEGFTLKRDLSTKIRMSPDPKASRDVVCLLKKGATYHPWNAERVKSSKLEFITYVKKVPYRLPTPATLTLINEKTEKEEIVKFAKHDEWTYLTYYAEGMFRMEYKGVIYTAEQELFDVSREKGSDGANSIHERSEWMKLTCANGKSGWLLYVDMQELPEIEKPKFPEYGKAVDKN